MFRFNRKKSIILLICALFFIIIPIVKNETRLIEKKIQSHKSQILRLEKNLLEARLEFQYLASPEVLTSKVNENIDLKYKNLKFSQIYLNLEDFIKKQKKITKFSIKEK